MDTEDILHRLSALYDIEVLEALSQIKAITTKDSQDEKKLQSYVKLLSKELKNVILQRQGGENSIQTLSVSFEKSGVAGKNPKISIIKSKHGVTTKKYIANSFFSSKDYKTMVTNRLKIKGLIEKGAYVTKGENKQNISSFDEAISWLMNLARKGQYIQRYKGLGEMNPDQLWETTVNPETRRLLQVKVEDALKADEVFTTLMGDHVEPRREFIEKNALSATNIDI